MPDKITRNQALALARIERSGSKSEPERKMPGRTSLTRSTFPLCNSNSECKRSSLADGTIPDSEEYILRAITRLSIAHETRTHLQLEKGGKLGSDCDDDPLLGSRAKLRFYFPRSILREKSALRM